MLNQDFVGNRHRIIPNLKMGVQLLRLGREDSVVASAIVNYVRYKENGRTERKSMVGPVSEKSATIHFYKVELGNWVLTEDDLVVIDGEWWRIDLIDRRQMQTKFICTCTASTPVAGVGAFAVGSSFVVG